MRTSSNMNDGLKGLLRKAHGTEPTWHRDKVPDDGHTCVVAAPPPGPVLRHLLMPATPEVIVVDPTKPSTALVLFSPKS